MAHNSNGVVSFAAMTEEPKVFEVGTTQPVNLSSRIRTWDLQYRVDGGELAVGKTLLLQTEEDLSRSETVQMIDGTPGEGGNASQIGSVFYDSDSFTGSSEAEFEASLPVQAARDTSVLRRTPPENRFRRTPLVIETETLLQSMHMRVSLPADSRWGDAVDGVVRPHPSKQTLRLSEITSEVGISF
jgi:hypothetical protein